MPTHWKTRAQGVKVDWRELPPALLEEGKNYLCHVIFRCSIHGTRSKRKTPTLCIHRPYVIPTSMFRFKFIHRAIKTLTMSTNHANLVPIPILSITTAYRSYASLPKRNVCTCCKEETHVAST